MGTLRFRLPDDASPEMIRDLDRACVAGGYDNMPSITKSSVADGVLQLVRDADESGYIVCPWEVAGIGRLMGSTATLIERADPYLLTMELARGKINQVRNQAAEWRGVGMVLSEALETRIRDAAKQFGKVVTHHPAAETDFEAVTALACGYDAGRDLVSDYTEQIFKARHSRQPKLDALLGVRINGSVPPTASSAIGAGLNGVSLPLSWRSVEPTESNYRWEPTDTALAWAERNNLRVAAGPLIDFSQRGLPDWLWLWEGDLQSLASFMCDYVETAVGRYRGRIRRWQLATAANLTGVLKLGEDDLLWLTARLAEAAWQVDPELELCIGVAQPWGEYMARRECTYSPFIFADTLIRAGLKLSTLDLELITGVTHRGSYCRDLLDTSRLLDLYALLGVPLQVTMGYPADNSPDALADPALALGAGHWQNGYNPETQAAWADDFTHLAISKPYIRAVYWSHLTDGEEHQFANCGMLDAAGRPRPLLGRYRQIRADHLK